MHQQVHCFLLNMLSFGDANQTTVKSYGRARRVARYYAVSFSRATQEFISMSAG